MNTEHFKQRLEEEKTLLIEQLQTVGRVNPSNPGDWEPIPSETSKESDPNDQADYIENYEENTAILKDLEIRYNNVLGALDRIEKGTYGACAVSGEEIEEDRVEADPAAKTCKAHLEVENA